MLKNILKKDSKREDRGITLISLVITIILLLILAAVTLNLVIGEGGIFEIAGKAGKNYMNAQEKESAELESLNNELQKYSIGSNRENAGISYDVLWSGHYNTSVESNATQTSGGCKLFDGYSIEDYKFLVTVWGIGDATMGKPTYKATLLPMDLFKQNYGNGADSISNYADTTYNCRGCVGFIDKSTFFISWRAVSGWGDFYISHIYGIK